MYLYIIGYGSIRAWLWENLYSLDELEDCVMTLEVEGNHLALSSGTMNNGLDVVFIGFAMECLHQRMDHCHTFWTFEEDFWNCGYLYLSKDWTSTVKTPDSMYIRIVHE